MIPGIRMSLSLSLTSSTEQINDMICSLYHRLTPLNATSFASPHESISAQAYVGGSAYFTALLSSLRSAQKEILITDWWLSPEIFLQRPVYDLTNFTNRLDFVLKERAEAGIIIRVLLWEEQSLDAVSIPLPFDEINSDKVLSHLEGLHSNIRVIIHNWDKRYSHHQKSVIIDRSFAYVGGIDLCYGRWDNNATRLVDLDMSVWPYLDYVNREHDPALSDQDWDTNLFNRSEVPRTPWHDVQMSVDGPAAYDVARNFIQRWNNHAGGKSGYDPLDLTSIPSSPGEGQQTCQVVRSITQDSGGFIGWTEQSIYGRYLDMITKAEHFVYIENQYFISSLASDQTGDLTGAVNVQNVIAQTLLDRIVDAIENQQKFRVIIVTPLYAEGGYKTETVRATMYLQYATVGRWPQSMIAQLSDRYPSVDISQYLLLLALRTHDVLPIGTVTSIIYLHAKLMVVDDRMAIIGSANINDRSMMGDHDTELCVVCGMNVTDTIPSGDVTTSTLNGVTMSVSTYVFNLRMELMNQHLGRSIGDRTWADLLDDTVWQVHICLLTLIAIASLNDCMLG
jgi:phospholipase D1/2